MFYKIKQIKNKLDRAWFNYRCRNVYQTPQVVCNPSSNVIIISQLYHPDITMYMLAAKSFSRYLRPRAFLIVDDGLSEKDRQILSIHFDTIQFIKRKAVAIGQCPEGGTWERIITLSQNNNDNYVIQLDSDTLTLKEPSEVLRCISLHRSFTLGTKSGQEFVGLKQASKYAHEHPSDHIQNHAERALGKYPGEDKQKYVRGCSGFTGFSKGELKLVEIEKFSTCMENMLGKNKWKEWGTEQVTSNYMAANASDSIVLPIERYPFWRPKTNINNAVFVHFFGTFRFQGGEYIRQGLQIIKQLIL